MPIAKTMREIKSMSDEQLIREYDEIAESTMHGTSFYLDELRARESSRVATSVQKFTKWIFWLTVVVTASTLVNLVLFAVRG